MSGNEFAGFEFNVLSGYDTPTELSVLTSYDESTGVKNVDMPAGNLDIIKTQNFVSLSSMPLDNFGLFLPPTTELAVAVVYRLRGYYVAGMTYEFWTGASVDTPNPSGNPLVSVVVDATLS